MAASPWQRCLTCVLCSLLIAISLAGAGEAQRPQGGSPGTHDPCEEHFGLPASEVRKTLDARLRYGFPIEAQLDEGHARLAAPSILLLDCEQQRVLVSGAYEFRGNIGVMDVTRRGALILRLQLVPGPEPQQLSLTQAQLQEITFENPAPWFDGKAIRDWGLDLFATPTCARLRSGLPC